MEKENKSEVRYILANIQMPIEIRDLETDDFVCLQDRAHVTIELCRELPPIAPEGECYEGLADKIHAYYDSLSICETMNSIAEMTGTDSLSVSNDKEKARTKKRHVTFRNYELGKSRRFTEKRNILFINQCT